MFTIKKYLIIAAVLAAAGFALWQYYTYTQNQIRIYAENAAKSEMEYLLPPPPVVNN